MDADFYFNNAWRFVKSEGEKSYNAIANFEAAIRLDPFNGGYHSDFGNSYRSFKKFKEAETSYTKVVENCFTRNFV